MATPNQQDAWLQAFLDQLADAWNKHALEVTYGDDHDDLGTKAVAGFALATQLAAADSLDDIIDAVNVHIATITERLGEEAKLDVFHAALLNLTITFLKPALDVLRGSDHDVREVAVQMWEAIKASDRSEL